VRLTNLNRMLMRFNTRRVCASMLQKKKNCRSLLFSSELGRPTAGFPLKTAVQLCARHAAVGRCVLHSIHRPYISH